MASANRNLILMDWRMFGQQNGGQHISLCAFSQWLRIMQWPHRHVQLREMLTHNSLFEWIWLFTVYMLGNQIRVSQQQLSCPVKTKNKIKVPRNNKLQRPKYCAWWESVKGTCKRSKMDFVRLKCSLFCKNTALLFMQPCITNLWWLWLLPLI